MSHASLFASCTNCAHSYRLCLIEGGLLAVYSARSRRGGVDGPSSAGKAGVAGRLRTYRARYVHVWGPGPFPVLGDAGTNCVYARVRQHVDRMPRARIVWICSWLRDSSRPALLEMSTNSAGHLARERLDYGSSVCLCVGTKRMCRAGICTKAFIFPCSLMAAELHGVCLNTGSIKMAMKTPS